jgi:hypothetical protein
MCSFARFFWFKKIGWYLAVLCHFKKIFEKFRIYRCHPVNGRVDEEGFFGSLEIPSKCRK